MAFRRFAQACALLASVAALAGCGVSNQLDPVAAAATKSEQAGGFNVNFTLKLSGSSMPGGSTVLTGSGAFDGAQGEMTIDMAGLLGQTGADGQLREIMLQEDGHLVMYMQVPFVASLLPGGKTWMRLDLQEAGKSLGVDLSKLLGQAGSTNPAETLAMLKSNGDFAAVGPETIDGVSTTHYKGAVDLARAASSASLPDSYVERLRAMGAPTQVPVDAWIGDDGLLREVDLSYGSDETAIDLTMKMSDYGRTVSVSAPPADEVFDATALATKGLHAGTG